LWINLFDFQDPHFYKWGVSVYGISQRKVSTIGINKDVIREYIKKQEEADLIEDKANR